jgi:HEAT repeat protein
VIALARIGDARAGEALGGLLDEDDFAPQVAAELVHLEDSYRVHADVLGPWLVGALSSTDEQLRRNAAGTCGRLRVAGSGQALLALARTESWDRFATRHVLAAARAWPSREVFVEVERQWEAGHERDHLMEAFAELAAHAPAGVYEGPLRRCADLLAEQSHDGSLSRQLAGALQMRGMASRPLLERIIRKSRHSQAQARALEALYEVDPLLAERHARKVWKKCPSGAVTVWGKRYAGSADTEAVDLVRRAGEHSSAFVRLDAVKALTNIGGPAAAAAAGELASGTDDPEVARLARVVGRPDLLRRLAQDADIDLGLTP